MPTRHTKIIPGFDDIINGCDHEPKGNHGRCGEQWLYIVRTDDGRAALYLEVHTSIYPSTTPHKETPPAGLRGLRLELHLAVPYVDYDGEICHPGLQRNGSVCAILDRPLCSCPEYSSLASMKFFDEHYVKGATPEQPESFWLALEAELAEQLLKTNFFNEDEDEERMLGWLRDPRTTPASHRDVVRWIGQNAFKATQLNKQAEADRVATEAKIKEIVEVTAQIASLTKQVELAQAMIKGLAKPAPDPVKTPARCWCGEQIVHINWCREHAPRCNSSAHFHGNCLCEGPTAAFWERWDREIRPKRNASSAASLAEQKLTFGELKIGDHFICWPIPGDNAGHGGYLGATRLFVKTGNETANNGSGVQSYFHAPLMVVIKVSLG